MRKSQLAILVGVSFSQAWRPSWKTSPPSKYFGEEQLLEHFQLGMRLAGARDLADDLNRAADLDTAQFQEVVAGVDDRADARVALQVGPALAARDRVEPQAALVPQEPQRGRVRAVRADRGDPAGALGGEELVGSSAVIAIRRPRLLGPRASVTGKCLPERPDTARPRGRHAPRGR